MTTTIFKRADGTWGALITRTDSGEAVTGEWGLPTDWAAMLWANGAQREAMLEGSRWL